MGKSYCPSIETRDLNVKRVLKSPISPQRTIAQPGNGSLRWLTGWSGAKWTSPIAQSMIRGCEPCTVVTTGLPPI